MMSFSDIYFGSCGTGMSKFVATAEMTEDRAAVAGLPYQSALPRRRAGPVLANYLKQREQNYQAALQDLTDKTAMLNAEINARIRTNAENLLSSIEQNQVDIKCIVDSRVNKTLSTVSHFKALNNVKHLHAHRVREIAQFKESGLALEKERAHRLREILNNNFARLVAIGKIPPKDLLHDFDLHAFDANHQLLSNSRAFVDLEARLRAQADASIGRARASLNQLSLGVRSTVRQFSAQHTSKRSSSIRPSLSASNGPKCESAALGPIKNVEQFTKCVQLVNNVYNNALQKMLSSYSSHFLNLRNGVEEFSREKTPVDEFALSELSLLTEKLRRFAIYTEHRHTCIHNDAVATYNDALNLSKMLERLRELLQTMFDIFYDASHLYDAHVTRTAFAQKITMAEVENLATRNDSVELATEISFSITLDKLCNSANIDILHKSYNDSKRLIDHIKKLYFSNSEDEIKPIAQFMDLCMAMTNILLAEFNCFLERYSTAPIQPTESITAVPSTLDAQRDSAVTDTRPLARVIYESEVQAQVLQKRKNGFLECFESNISAVSDDLKRQAKSWVKNKTDIMNARYNLKMVSHSIRMERLKAAWEKRQAELKFNEDRLQSHLIAILDLIYSLPKEASECLSIDAPSLYPFCERVYHIEKNVDDLIAQDLPDSAMTKMKMASYHPRLVKHLTLFEVSLQKAIDENKVNLEDRLQAARISNFRYISVLKLLHEGGSYSNVEIKNTVAALVWVANNLEKCGHTIHDCLARRQGHLLQMAHKLMAPLLSKTEYYLMQTVEQAETTKPTKTKKRVTHLE